MTVAAQLAPSYESLHALRHPSCASGCPPTGYPDFDRLASMVAIYMPATLPAYSSASNNPADGANGINTSRDKNAPQSFSVTGAGGLGASIRRASPPQASKQVIDLSGFKRKCMLHDELSLYFPGERLYGPRRQRPPLLR